MSIATKLQTLLTLKNRIERKLDILGILPQGDEGLSDCADAIDDMGGTKIITNTQTTDVAINQYAQVQDSNLVPGNIVSGVSILGVTGTASVTPPSAQLEQGFFEYGGARAPSTLYPGSGYDGFSQVVPILIDASPKLAPKNIRNGVTIMGVTGNYETPTQTKSMSLGAGEPTDVTPNSGYALSRVSPNIDNTVIKAENIKQGVNILGVTGTLSGLSLQYASPTVNVNGNVLQVNVNFTNLNKIVYLTIGIRDSLQYSNGQVISCYYYRIGDYNWYAGLLYLDGNSYTRRTGITPVLSNGVLTYDFTLYNLTCGSSYICSYCYET